jgi:hypothetical protein
LPLIERLSAFGTVLFVALHATVRDAALRA